MKKIIQLSWVLLTACFIACEPNSSNEMDWQLTGFEKADSINPILVPDQVTRFDCPLSNRQIEWASRNVLNPAAVVRNDTVFLFYRAQDKTGTSRIGLAHSLDGLHFTKYDQPVFYPDEDHMKKFEWNHLKISGEADTIECVSCLFDGVEDPRIVQHPEGGYVMTYTTYDGKTARLASATSNDLKNWSKQGLVLKDSIYQNYWSKSGAIVSVQEGNDIIATKIDGKYWMYFGDKRLHMATSEDLINWSPLVDNESGQLISVLNPRPGFFDSRLVEPGPYALKTTQGILLIYNASNASNLNEAKLSVFTYAAGQALFDLELPYRLKDRTDGYFIYPDKPYEKTGEVNEVCFVEGLVPFQSKWYLYYGTADSRIAVAVTR